MLPIFKMCAAIKQQELGWSFYLCEKVSDRLSWIYDTKDHPNSFETESLYTLVFQKN